LPLLTFRFKDVKLPCSASVLFNMLRVVVLFTGVLAAGLIVLAAVGKNSGSTVVTNSAIHTSPVVVELFTSEGCSSCPPADALLTELDHQPIPGAEVIALGLHVDYWNQLGWVDRFSSNEFTHRQNEYGRRFGLDSVYTPQMVVDGRYEFVGNDSNRARKVIADEAQKTCSVEVELQQVDDHTLNVQVKNAGGSPDVLLAITENGLSTSVRAGENGGRELRHSAVVRELTRLGTAKAGQFQKRVTVPKNDDWKRVNLRAVAFVQTAGTGEILGAAAIRLK